MKFRRKPRENVEIGLAPLIDVVFILLLFFVVSTTFTRETALRVDLPEAASGKPAEHEQTELEIVIDSNGAYAVNGHALATNDLDTLMDALQKASNGDNQQPLIISADGKTAHQAVITALDAAGKLGFAQLRITTVESQEDN